MTGAVILVALVVLLVPELLSGPRRAPRHAAMSVSEPPIRSYTLPLVDEPQAGTAAAQRDIADPSVPEPSDEAVQPGGTAQSDGAAQPGGAARQGGAAKTSAASDTSRPRTNSARPPAGAAVAAEGSAHEPVDGAGEVARSTPPVAAQQREDPHAAASASRGHASPSGAAARETPAAPARATPAGAWLVQVGSFASRGNADRLAHQLKRKGYGAFVSESTSRGRKWYRVRIGPERDRAAAAAVAARLHAAGHKGAVIRPR